MIASLAMTFSSVSVIVNALRLRKAGALIVRPLVADWKCQGSPPAVLP